MLFFVISIYLLNQLPHKAGVNVDACEYILREGILTLNDRFWEAVIKTGGSWWSG
jgi:hypothetical protein